MAFRFFESETGATAIVHKAVADRFNYVNPVTEDQLNELREAERNYKEENIPATCVETVMVATADGSQIERQ